MSGMRSAIIVAGSLLVGLALAGPRVLGADEPADSATQPATKPAEKTHTVGRGTLKLEIRTDATLLPLDAFELKLKLDAYAGPLVIKSIAAPWAPVKKGDLLLECETTEINWAIEGAENALAVARANLKKAEADAELAVKSEALAMRIQEDALKNAEAAVRWFESVDGPQMLLSSDLTVKSVRDSIEDQEAELDQLRKMYKSEELTNATADIVIKRAVRSLERSKIGLKMQEERRDKLRAHEYPNTRQRVLDNLEQARNSLASLKIAQEQSAVSRRSSLSAARIAVEQAERKLNDLRHDLGLFAVKSPVDGVVLYGNLMDNAWPGGDPRSVKPGEKLAAGQIVMRVFTPGKLRMEIGLSELQAFWVESGLDARITPNAFPLVRCEGLCGQVVAGPRGSPGAFGYVLPITLTGKVDPRIVPGMKAAVHIEAPRANDVLLVPVSAIEGGKASVKSKDGAIEKRDVVLGRCDGRNVEVISGLSAGEVVLLQASK